MGKEGETPAAELITTLQNRINDLEADLKAQKEAAAALPKFERKEFDDAIALIKAELAEVKREKAAVKKEEGASKKEEKPLDPATDDWMEVVAGCRRISIFED